MEATMRPRRSVHWSDQAHTPNPRRRRDGSPLSAAGALRLYLSEALCDSERRPTERRRNAFHAASTHDRTHSAPLCGTGAGASVQQAASDPPALEPPGSPLSRFLQRRVLHSGAPPTRLGASAPVARLPERALRSRALRLSATGSMERLLRERINEAKNIRDQTTRERENQPPNRKAVEQPSAKEVIEDVDDSPRLAWEVPVPHAKPQCPQIQVSTSTMRSEKCPRTSDLSPNKHHPTRRKKDFEGAARRIQATWRLDSARKQPQAEQIPVGIDIEARRLKEAAEIIHSEQVAEERVVDKASGEATLSHVPSDEALAGRRESVIDIAEDTIGTHNLPQADQYEPIALQPATETTTEGSPMSTRANYSAKTVMWLDDEWSFLEEGRYATNELLDSPAHNEDTSIEALVWKKPHVAIALQEAKRRAVESARRTRSKQRRRDVASSKLDNVPVQAKPLHIKIRHKVQRGRPVVLIEATRRRRRRLHTQSPQPESEALVLNDENLPSFHKVHSHDTTAKDPSPVEKPDDGAYAALLAQLHRYIDFPDAPPTVDSSQGDSIAVRNDLITMDSAYYPRVVPSDPEQGSEDGLDSPPLLSESSPSKTHDSLAPSAPSCLSPTLRHVEREFQHTMSRIQSQYSLALEPRPLDGSDAWQSDASRASAMASPVDAATQREFRRALDAFEQSLRASTSSAIAVEPLPRLPSPRGMDPPDAVGLGETALAVNVSMEEDNDGDDDEAVDAELEAMLREIQRCKHQIAQARRQSHT